MEDYSRADPELIRQLDDARDSDETVAAAVSVRRKRGVPPDVQKIAHDVRQAMARAQKTAKAEPTHLRVMPHLAVAYVEAPGRLIRALLEQPEVIGAVSGRADADEPPPATPASKPDAADGRMAT
jgi:hypothetical protein